MTQRVVNDCLIKSKLPHHFRLESNSLKLNDNKSTKCKMIKQHVYIIILTSHLQMHLSSNKRKALSQFEQELCNMVGKAVLDVLFTAMCISSCKIKQIRVFEHITYHV